MRKYDIIIAIDGDVSRSGVAFWERQTRRLEVANHRAEITICTSIMRREGIKPKLFDYRYNRSIT